MSSVRLSTRIFLNIVYINLVFLFNNVYSVGWVKHHEPLQRTSILNEHFLNGNKSEVLNKLVYEFHQNISLSNSFKLLNDIFKEDQEYIFIGGQNVLHNISLHNLKENTIQVITWSCSPENKAICDLKGKTESDCQNYIRVMSVINSNKLLVCGTNCYNPLCRHYIYINGSYQVETEFSGKGYVPYDPRHNSTFMYTGGHLYAATVADFSGTDPLIIKNNLRTEQYNYKHLNAPDFVNILEDEDFVYFFFREAAIEYMNCGKSIYSRVARVCKNDKGGSNKFSNRWTTFLKTRISCSVPGDYPFYFNNIQSTSHFLTDKENNKIFYGVFTTPENSIPGSAICQFSLSDVQDTFESDFKSQATVTSNWYPLSLDKVPDPRPGRCYDENMTMTESSLHFIKNNCLMNKSVPSRPSMPVFIKSGDSEMLTKIVIDDNVSNIYGEQFNVLFIGTNRGKVIKILIRSNNPDISSSILEEEIQVFSETIPVLDLMIVGPRGTDRKLVIVSSDSVKSISIENCQTDECSSCILRSRPYCAWDSLTQGCVSLVGVDNKTDLIQSESDCPISTTTQSTIPTTEVITTDITTILEEDTTTEEKTNDLTDTTTIKMPLTTTESSSTASTPVCPSCQCSCPTSVPDADIEILDNSSYLTETTTEETDIEREYVEEISTQEDNVKSEEEVTKSSFHESAGSVIQPDLLISNKKIFLISIACSVTSLLVGLIVGFFISQKFQIKSSASVTSSKMSLMNHNRLQELNSFDSGYLAPPLADINITHKNINLLNNGSFVNNKVQKTKITNTGTLQKVKRVYM